MFFGYPGRAITEQWQIHAAESTGEAFDFNIWLNVEAEGM
jgi:hypothetical protein